VRLNSIDDRLRIRFHLATHGGGPAIGRLEQYRKLSLPSILLPPRLKCNRSIAYPSLGLLAA
jgi:hypothetical protein